MKNVYSLYGAGQAFYGTQQKQNNNGIMAGTSQSWRALMGRLERRRMEVLMAVAHIYGTILEEEVTPKKAARLLNAQAAFLAILIFSYSPLLCLACVIWFAKSLIAR